MIPFAIQSVTNAERSQYTVQFSYNNQRVNTLIASIDKRISAEQTSIEEQQAIVNKLTEDINSKEQQIQDFYQQIKDYQQQQTEDNQKEIEKSINDIKVKITDIENQLIGLYSFHRTAKGMVQLKRMMIQSLQSEKSTILGTLKDSETVQACTNLYTGGDETKVRGALVLIGGNKNKAVIVTDERPSGSMSLPIGMSSESYFFNRAVYAGWLKWEQKYCSGIIRGVDDNGVVTADIEPYNAPQLLLNEPIYPMGKTQVTKSSEYSYEIGDHALIKIGDNDFQYHGWVCGAKDDYLIIDNGVIVKDTVIVIVFNSNNAKLYVIDLVYSDCSLSNLRLLSVSQDAIAVGSSDPSPYTKPHFRCNNADQLIMDFFSTLEPNMSGILVDYPSRIDPYNLYTLTSKGYNLPYTYNKLDFSNVPINRSEWSGKPYYKYGSDKKIYDLGLLDLSMRTNSSYSIFYLRSGIVTPPFDSIIEDLRYNEYLKINMNKAKKLYNGNLNIEIYHSLADQARTNTNTLEKIILV